MGKKGQVYIAHNINNTIALIVPNNEPEFITIEILIPIQIQIIKKKIYLVLIIITSI